MFFFTSDRNSPAFALHKAAPWLAMFGQNVLMIQFALGSHTLLVAKLFLSAQHSNKFAN